MDPDNLSAAHEARSLDLPDEVDGQSKVALARQHVGDDGAYRCLPMVELMAAATAEAELASDSEIVLRAVARVAP